MPSTSSDGRRIDGLAAAIEGIGKDASIFEKHEDAAYDFCL
jgi:hypothetical protein